MNYIINKDEKQLILSNEQSMIKIGLGISDIVCDITINIKDLFINELIGDIDSRDGLEVVFNPIRVESSILLDVVSHLKWYEDEGVLRKFIKFKFNGSINPIFIEQLILDEISLSSDVHMMNNINPYNACSEEMLDCNSQVAYLDEFFMGIEFPSATTCSIDGKLIISHAPCFDAEPDVWYTSRTLVCGLTSSGQSSRKAFETYIKRKAVKNDKIHFNYNSWWTSPVPYKEADILNLLDTFNINLYKHGANFDTFTIDLGWSNPESIWEIDKDLFPDGFNNLQRAAHSQKSAIGLWFSPSACYEPALHNNYAHDNGYHVSSRKWAQYGLKYLCLASDKYVEMLIKNLCFIVKKYDIKQVKVDGAFFDCSSENHGHRSELGAIEKATENIIKVFSALRSVVPDIWIESTCFHMHPSPWWIMYVSSVTGIIGDDCPHGICPSPVHRESLTTARDFYNLQGCMLNNAPVSYQDVLGIIHQTNDDFTNDSVTTILRGNMFISMYINPKYMDDKRYERMSKLMNWARKNEKILQDTAPIMYQSWKGEMISATSKNNLDIGPYGYQHYNECGSLILLRNPNADNTVMEITVPGSEDYCDIISLYPEVRCYAKGVSGGKKVDIPLLPYETLVLTYDKASGECILFKQENAIKVDTKISQKNDSILTLDTYVTVGQRISHLLILLESDIEITEKPHIDLCVNGKAADCSYSSTKDNWDATVMERVEHWLYIIAPLQPGENHISLNMEKVDAEVSAHIWSRKAGLEKTDIFCHDNTLPPPEYISVESKRII